MNTDNETIPAGRPLIAPSAVAKIAELKLAADTADADRFAAAHPHIKAAYATEIAKRRLSMILAGVDAKIVDAALEKARVIALLQAKEASGWRPARKGLSRQVWKSRVRDSQRADRIADQKNRQHDIAVAAQAEIDRERDADEKHA